jgi:anaerobic magnesium-protoporphyrin IX monomethyl ester cyclase
LISRGCPYDCAFCVASSFWGRKIRVKDTEIIEEMIEQINVLKFEIISLWDDSLWSLINTKIGKEIINILSAYKSLIKWRTHLRVDQLLQDNIKILSNAGCTTIRVGVETLISESQKSIGKEFKVEELETGLQIAKHFGLEVWCSMIVGLPGDTYNAILETLEIMYNFLIKGFISHVDFRPLTVLPGSKFYKNFNESGFTRIVENHYSPKNISVVTKSINYGEIDSLLKKYNDFLLPLSRIKNFRN